MKCRRKCRIRRLVFITLFMVYTITFFSIGLLTSESSYIEFITKNYAWKCITVTEEKPVLFIGIYSLTPNKEIRAALRETVLIFGDDFPFNIRYKFFLDKKTVLTETENSINNDILYTNATPGTNKHRSMLTALFKYVNEQRDLTLVGKIDDHVFICVPQIMQRLGKIGNKKLLYALKSTRDTSPDAGRAYSEFFLVLGIDLMPMVNDILKCSRCIGRNLLVHGIETHPQAHDVIFRYDVTKWISYEIAKKEYFERYIEPNFCNSHWLFHPVTSNELRYLHNITNNLGYKEEHRLFASSELSVGVKRNDPTFRYLGRAKSGIKDRKLPHCLNWSVIYADTKPSETLLKLDFGGQWCILIVGSKWFPSYEAYIEDRKLRNTKRVVFLTPDEQYSLYPSMSFILPWDHVGRKNIGYIHAIKHGAQFILDISNTDTDIMAVENIEYDIDKSASLCQAGFNHGTIFNPYDFFGFPGSGIWPRGIPLQSISQTFHSEDVCFNHTDKRIAILQSVSFTDRDWDAVCKLARKSLYFKSRKRNVPFVVPKGMYAPIYAHSTVWSAPAFLFLALPITVSDLVSDVWRGFIAQYFLEHLDLHVAYVPPNKRHYDISHSVDSVFEQYLQEKNLFLKNHQFIETLVHFSELRSAKTNLFDVFKELYKRGFLERRDVVFINQWISTLEPSTI